MKFLILALLVLVTACSNDEKMTDAKAIELAEVFAAKNNPKLDISQKPPRVTYFPDAEAHGGGELWAVGFSVPAPKHEDGKTIGVRHYWSYAVWVKADGETYGGMLHTP